jgi:putative phosphoribosyl transferase
MGAIAEGGVHALNQHIIDEARILPSTVDQVIARQRMELERDHRRYRRRRASRPLKGWNVILVDDGLATGATMEAAVHALREF